MCDLEGWLVVEEDFYVKYGEVVVDKGVFCFGCGEFGMGIMIDCELVCVNYELVFDVKCVEGSDFFCGLIFLVGEDYLMLIVGGWGGGVIGVLNFNGMLVVENEIIGY